MLAAAILATSVAATEPREWYGYYNLAFDSAAVGVLAISRTFRTTEGQTNLAVASLVIYTLGGPLVHFGHGKVGTGFASLGLRAGGPLVAAGVGCVVTVAVSPGAPACAIGAGGGAVVGAAIAVVLDATVLAYKERPFRLSPSGSITRDGATFGLSGTF
jgi:hypothetical protein